MNPYSDPYHGQRNSLLQCTASVYEPLHVVQGPTSPPPTLYYGPPSNAVHVPVFIPPLYTQPIIQSPAQHVSFRTSHSQVPPTYAELSKCKNQIKAQAKPKSKDVDAIFKQLARKSGIKVSVDPLKGKASMKYADKSNNHKEETPVRGSLKVSVAQHERTSGISESVEQEKLNPVKEQERDYSKELLDHERESSLQVVSKESITSQEEHHLHKEQDKSSLQKALDNQCIEGSLNTDTQKSNNSNIASQERLDFDKEQDKSFLPKESDHHSREGSLYKDAQKRDNLYIASQEELSGDFVKAQVQDLLSETDINQPANNTLNRAMKDHDDQQDVCQDHNEIDCFVDNIVTDLLKKLMHELGCTNGLSNFEHKGEMLGDSNNNNGRPPLSQEDATLTTLCSQRSIIDNFCKNLLKNKINQDLLNEIPESENNCTTHESYLRTDVSETSSRGRSVASSLQCSSTEDMFHQLAQKNGIRVQGRSRSVSESSTASDSSKKSDSIADDVTNNLFKRLALKNGIKIEGRSRSSSESSACVNDSSTNKHSSDFECTTDNTDTLMNSALGGAIKKGTRAGSKFEAFAQKSGIRIGKPGTAKDTITSASFCEQKQPTCTTSWPLPFNADHKTDTFEELARKSGITIGHPSGTQECGRVNKFDSSSTVSSSTVSVSRSTSVESLSYECANQEDKKELFELLALKSGIKIGGIEPVPSEDQAEIVPSYVDQYIDDYFTSSTESGFYEDPTSWQHDEITANKAAKALSSFEELAKRCGIKLGSSHKKRVDVAVQTRHKVTNTKCSQTEEKEVCDKGTQISPSKDAFEKEFNCWIKEEMKLLSEAELLYRDMYTVELAAREEFEEKLAASLDAHVQTQRSHKRTCEEMKETLKGKDEQIEKLTKDLKTLKRHKESEIKRLNKDLKQKETELEEAKEEICLKEAAIFSMRQMATERTEELQGLKERMTELETKLAELEGIREQHRVFINAQKTQPPPSSAKDEWTLVTGGRKCRTRTDSVSTQQSTGDGSTDGRPRTMDLLSGFDDEDEQEFGKERKHRSYSDVAKQPTEGSVIPRIIPPSPRRIANEVRPRGVSNNTVAKPPEVFPSSTSSILPAPPAIIASSSPTFSTSIASSAPAPSSSMATPSSSVATSSSSAATSYPCVIPSSSVATSSSSTETPSSSTGTSSPCVATSSFSVATSSSSTATSSNLSAPPASKADPEAGSIPSDPTSVLQQILPGLPSLQLSGLPTFPAVYPGNDLMNFLALSMGASQMLNSGMVSNATHIPAPPPGLNTEPLPADDEPQARSVDGPVTKPQANKYSSFDRLMKALREAYPAHSRPQLMMYLKEAKKSCGNAGFKGMQISEVVDKVGEIIRKEEQEN